MSIQAGVWNFDDGPVEPELLQDISGKTSKYGPDGAEMASAGSACLLYRPFHTTAESRLEHQPYYSRRGRLITWDGRLDNRDELIAALSTDLRDDRTDVAVVAAALDIWGTSAFVKFIGDWAISIWDPYTKEVILARDYIGVRHLFYYIRGNRVLWCNHLSPLALCGDHFTICDEYIAGYLAFQPEAHLTPYREIHSVPPGHFVRVLANRTTKHAYWQFRSALIRYKTDAEYEEHYRYLFRQSVRRRLRTDSPILSELSGGLDSSSMVCMADDILTKEEGGTHRLNTFSYFDSNEPREDDFIHFIAVEKKRGRAGFIVDLKGSGDSLPLYYSDFVAVPGFGSRAEIKTAISKVAEEGHFRVMLSGTGGDEVNGQTLDPHIFLADLLIGLQIVKFGKQLVAWSLKLRKPINILLFNAILQLLPTAVRSRFLERATLEPWVDLKFAQKQRLAIRQLAAVDDAWFFRPRVRDAAEGLAGLARLLTHTSPSLLEHRYPYLDQTLAEFLARVPLEQLLRVGERRSLMRRALAGMLPPEIVTRKSKAGAARCYSVALENHWSEIEDLYIAPLSGRLGYVDKIQTRKSLAAMKAGQVPHRFLRLMKALSLELWLREAQLRNVISVGDREPLAMQTGLEQVVARTDCESLRN